MRTLFLQAPSFDGFDGGAGSRYQAKREIKSFWYPTWLAQPAAMVENSRLIDAPPHNQTLQDVLDITKDYDAVVMHTSIPSFQSDVKTAEAMKAVNPDIKIGMIGAKVAVDADKSMRDAPVVDPQHDLLSALDAWVEQGKAPGTMIASKTEPDGSKQDTVVRTRPICAFPHRARYLGHGSTDDAANFACS